MQWVEMQKARPGDRVVAAVHRVGESGREGEVLDVLGGPGHRHVRVRWADGHESMVYSGADVRIEHVGLPAVKKES